MSNIKGAKSHTIWSREIIYVKLLIHELYSLETEGSRYECCN